MSKENKPKLLLVVYHPVGGIRTYFKDVYGMKVFNQYCISLIAPKIYVEDLRDYVFVGRGVEYISFDNKLDLVNVIWKTLGKEKFNLVHSHGYTSGLLTSLPAFIRRSPHIFTAHDVFQEERFVGAQGFIKQQMIGLGLRMIDCVMAVGNEARENISKYFPFLKNHKKLIFIRNGIDVEKFSVEKKRDLHTELAFKKEVVLFGFFGRFMQEKGFRLLVDAACELIVEKPTLKFRVIAFGWGGYIREDQEYIRDKGVNDYFVFMPHTDDMPAAIRGVDVVVMPSLCEACGLLAMETMVSGVPIISSNCIGLNEVTTDTPAISFQFGSMKSLKHSMVDYFDNPVEYKKKALAFRGEAYQRFDVTDTAARLNQQYLQMIKGYKNA